MPAARVHQYLNTWTVSSPLHQEYDFCNSSSIFPVGSIALLLPGGFQRYSTYLGTVSNFPWIWHPFCHPNWPRSPARSSPLRTITIRSFLDLKMKRSNAFHQGFWGIASVDKMHEFYSNFIRSCSYFPIFPHIFQYWTCPNISHMRSSYDHPRTGLFGPGWVQRVTQWEGEAIRRAGWRNPGVFCPENIWWRHGYGRKQLDPPTQLE